MTSSNQEPSYSLRVQRISTCPLCKSEGEILYKSLRDHLYGVPGQWDIRRCSSSDCRLAWLNPCPVSEDIGKAYLKYYTHLNQSDSGNLGAWFFTTFDSLKTKSLWLSRTRRSRQRMYLDRTTPGRMLDIGCGSGILLRLLRKAGWDAEGQEVDDKAAESARRYSGCHIHIGPLASLSLPAGGFDAITMSHVIEHAHDPVDLLRQSRELLRSGGQLIAVTPNLESLGHKIYGPDWRGLEPPRHLVLFSSRAIRRCAELADLYVEQIFTTSAFAAYFSLASQDVRNRRLDMPATPSYISAMRFKIASTLLDVSASGLGEELVLVATRK